MAHALNRILIFCSILVSVLGAPVYALHEIFEPYVPPQAAGMGGAIAADVQGYLANYYNPAGLAKGFRGKWEVVLLDLEGNFGVNALSKILGSQSAGPYQMYNRLQNSPNQYHYFSLTSVPAVSTRNFSFSLLANQRFAGESDGTNADVSFVTDVAPTFAFASNFLGNKLKLGMAVKILDRAEIGGIIPGGSVTSEDQFASTAKEGIAVGGDIGMMYTYPAKYLPTIAAVWKDALNTRFISPSTLLNKHASGGLPSDIPQSFNAAFSIRPAISRTLRTAIAFQYNNIERTDLPLLKHMHLGFQLDNTRSFYLWFGMNGLHPGGGVALRLPGGNLELATYGAEIGAGDEFREDRRFLFRYTIGF